MNIGTKNTCNNKKLFSFLKLLLFIFLMINLNSSFALDNLILKLEPKKVITNGTPIYFNITLTNIPPKGSLKVPDSYKDNAGEADGGCSGIDLYINYSSKYLKPSGFNWSEVCNDADIKEYSFKEGQFKLSITLNDAYYGDTLSIGKISFVPTREGNATLNISGVVSSGNGVKYDGINEYRIGKSYNYAKYPKVVFKGAEVIITKGNNNINISLEELNKKGSLNSSSNYDTNTNSIKVIANVINNINISVNKKSPKIIIKEINSTEYEPNISVTVNIKNDGKLDYGFIVSLFVGSLISGALFGFMFRGRRL